ncbi:aldo/keto reductase [Limisalsivibrio acetivorans]|uniref:aldo/keto reductase n=1 Tax=Limisalsivibrio acetivorans TaxID=1304888 RepID=UPI0003B4F786|nr:aldo/keto reductase [Limisalsivibrio acetivorans]
MSNVEMTILGKSGIEVSKVCLGTWAIGGWMWGGSDEKESVESIRKAINNGINFIDTAPVYGFGESERVVGIAVKDHVDRSKVVLATKTALEWTDDGVFRNSTPERIRKEVEDSLRRLQTDYIDLYQIHWPDPLVPFEETAETLDKLMQEGKIRAAGVSNYSPEQMEAFTKGVPITSVQPPYNLFERGIEDDVLPYAKNHGITVLAYSSICRGMLSGKMSEGRNFEGDDLRKVDPKFQMPRFRQYLDAVDELDKLAREHYDKTVLELAVRWVIEQGAIPLWGARKPHQLDNIQEVFGWSISPQDMKEIDNIIERNVKDPVGPEFMAPPSRK